MRDISNDPEWMGWDKIRKAEKRIAPWEGNGLHFHKMRQRKLAEKEKLKQSEEDA